MFAYRTSALKFEGMSDAALNGQAVEHLYGVWSPWGWVGWVGAVTKTKISASWPGPGSYSPLLRLKTDWKKLEFTVSHFL